MRHRQSLPRLWLMTDERMGDALWPALARLPRGSGVVFRHHATPGHERRRLFAELSRTCRRRGIVLVVAGSERLGGGTTATHGGRGSLTWPAHDRRQAIAAVRAGARIVFVSPVFATRSHPSAPALGPLRAAGIARGLPVMRIALGGLDAGRFRPLRGMGFHGWAAIDAWAEGRRSATDAPSRQSRAYVRRRR